MADAAPHIRTSTLYIKMANVEAAFRNLHQDLLDGCQIGDQKAQFQIYKLYYKAMYNTSLRIVNDTMEAEDVMQEAFLSAFEKIDKPCLQPLPATRYEYSEWKEAKVQFNYHVEFEGFFYSVHHTLINKPCSIRATVKAIEIYVDNQRVAAYARNYNTFRRYTTLPEHMPENHKAVSGWSDERFISWAHKIGPNTEKFIKTLLKSRQFPVQSYRSCMAILALAKDSPSSVMENAAALAIEREVYSYKYFGIIFKQELSKSAIEIKSPRIISHDNIRGKSAYVGGGINA